MSLFHRFFYSYPTNKFIRTVLKPLRKISGLIPEIPVSGKLKIDFSDFFFFLKTNPTNYLTREIFWRGPLNYEYTPIFLKITPHIQTFLDIGTNIGYYSILAAKSNPKCQVFGFEPSKGPLYYLKENVKLNSLDNIKIFGLALGNENGTISFFETRSKKFSYLNYQLSGTSNLSNTWNTKYASEYSVNVRKLDDLTTEMGITSVDLIKIDTEGTENIVFSGATETLQKFRPIIITEVLNGKIENELEEVFRKLNYRFYDLEGNVLTEKTSLVSDQKLDTNFLLVPEEKNHLLKEWGL